MKIIRERLPRTRRSPAEVYYTARGRGRFNGVWWNTYGWGTTPQKARLNLLWNLNRRRFPVE